MKKSFFRFLPAAAGVLLVCSCVTTRSFVLDELPAGSEKAYVSFRKGLGGDEFPLTIARVVDGAETAPLRTGDAWSGIGDFRVAVAPGRSEFVARSGSYSERFVVDARAGELRFIGFRRQFVRWSSVSSGNSVTTTSTWYVRGSAGSHAFPAEPAADASPYAAALDDADWATREYALRRLGELKPVPDAAAASRLRAIAVDDPVAALRSRARSLLADLGQPEAPKPLFIETFESNRDNSWPWEPARDKSHAFLFDPEGYRGASADGKEHWAGIGFTKSENPRFVKADFDLYLDCEWVEGQGTGAFGLAVIDAAPGPDQESRTADFLAFMIAKKGGAVALDHDRSGWKGKRIDWSNAAASSVSSGAVSRVMVKKRGADYEFLVNGVSVGKLTDKAERKYPAFGVVVTGRETVVFRRLVALAP